MTSNQDMLAGRLAELSGEVDRLRGEVRHSQAVSAAALSRATRLAQVVSTLAQLTDPQEIYARAAGEVAEQFSSDIVVFLTRAQGGSSPWKLAAHWGIPDRNVPVAVEDPPAQVMGLDSGGQLISGAAAELGVPPWLE